ncbi:hypothetical protein LTR86_000018 [Recurvomyces mirabilis]|nr:hypothetical protein LTR86_000018 [Recurvomyces mirabilis]
MATSSMRPTPSTRTSRRSIAPDTPSSRRPPPSSAVGRSTSNTLPDYEPPTFPLNPAAQRALADLLRHKNFKSLHSHLDEAVAGVTENAAAINDRVVSKRKEYAGSRKRSRPSDVNDENGDGEEDDADTIAKDLDDLQDKVDRMTQRMEETMRKMIDGKRGTQHIKESVLAAADEARVNASTQASTQMRTQRRTRASNEDDGDEDVEDFKPTDPTAGTQPQTAPVEVFRTKLDDAKTRYQSHSLAVRYAEDDDYVKFKGLVHDARTAEDPDEPELPHSRTWFPQEGDAPAPGVNTRAGASADDDSDDDIAIARTTISTRCPLTLQEFRDPLSSKKCNHNFEAEAFMSLLRGATNRINGKPAVQCPCGGCKETLTIEDLHRDPIVLRKIKRIQRARDLEAEEAQGGGGGLGGTQHDATLIDDDNDEEVNGADVDALLQRQTQMKAEPRGSVRSGGVVGSGSGALRSTAPIEVVEEEEGEEEEEEAEEEEEDDDPLPY